MIWKFFPFFNKRVLFIISNSIIKISYKPSPNG